MKEIAAIICAVLMAIAFFTLLAQYQMAAERRATIAVARLNAEALEGNQLVEKDGKVYSIQRDGSLKYEPEIFPSGNRTLCDKDGAVYYPETNPIKFDRLGNQIYPITYSDGNGAYYDHNGNVLHYTEDNDEEVNK